MEGVAFGEGDAKAWANLIVGFIGEVEVEVGIDELIQRKVEPDIEGVVEKLRVELRGLSDERISCAEGAIRAEAVHFTRLESEAHIGEYFHAAEVGKGLIDERLIEKLTRAKLEILHHHPGSDGDAFALPDNLEATASEGIVIDIGASLPATLDGEGAGAALTDVGTHFAEMVLPVGLWRQVGVGCHKEFYPVRGIGGVGKIGDVVRTVEVEAVVAECRNETVLLVSEVERRELSAATDVGFFACGSDDAVLNAVAKGVADAVEKVGLSEMDIVGNALLFGVALREEFVIDMSAEVAIVLKDVGGDLDTCFGRHLGNGDRGASKRVEHPLVETFARFIDIGIVEPKSNLQRTPLRGTAQERAVGLVGKGCIDFFECDGFSRSVLLVVHSYFFYTRVEHFPFRQMGGGGAGSQNAHYGQ